jgi:ribosome biogenesis GTPase / thiamine phosphate phosphatase
VTDDAHLRALGWDDALADAWDAVARLGDHPGRVARVDRGGWVDVLTAAGEERARLHPRYRRLMDPLAAPTVGDWVVLRPDQGGGPTRLETVLPRRTAFVRTAGDAGESRTQLVAANVDVALVVVPADLDPNVRRIDRLLAVAISSGARAVVVLSKVDACDDPGAVRAALAEEVGDLEVIAISAVTGEGLDAVDALVAPGRTVVLVGASGAGKSTLANRLAGEELLATAPVRGDGAGRHTTTHRQLVVLPGGALLIDTPGVRSIGTWERDEDAEEQQFADVEALIAACRFADCSHGGEPGCAVRAALDDGTLGADRWVRHLTIEGDRAERERRREAAEKAAETRRSRAARAKGRRPRR